MTTWNELETFAGDAGEIPEHLAAIAGTDEDAAWEAIEVLGDIAVPSHVRRDGPFCSAAPALVRELLDVVRTLVDDELKAAVLRLTAEILAANHRDLFRTAPDVPAALAILQGSGLGADVAATVRRRTTEVDAHLSSHHAPTRAAAWFLLGLVSPGPMPPAPAHVDDPVRHLRSFLAGLWREPLADGDFAWLGSLAGPHVLPEPATATELLAVQLPPNLFPLFGGRPGDFAAARSQALGGERGVAIAEALLRAHEGTRRPRSP
jgi:hypothetical protein